LEIGYEVAIELIVKLDRRSTFDDFSAEPRANQKLKIK